MHQPTSVAPALCAPHHPSRRIAPAARVIPAARAASIAAVAAIAAFSLAPTAPADVVQAFYVPSPGPFGYKVYHMPDLDQRRDGLPIRSSAARSSSSIPSPTR